MSIEVILLILLGGLAFNSFIGAINAKGTSRIVSSYILATMVLIGALFAIVQSVNQASVHAQKQREVELQAKLIEEQKLREEDALLAASGKASVEEKEIMDKLVDISEKGNKVIRRILSVNIDDLEEDEWEGVSRRASGYLGTASKLKRAVEDIKPMENGAFKESIEATKKAVDRLVWGASSFRKFFGAEDEDEEDALRGRYAGNLRSSRSSFRNAVKLVTDKK